MCSVPVTERLLECFAAAAVADPAQVPAGEKRGIKQVVGDPRRRASVERVLQGVEVGAAAVVQDDDLAVKPAAVDTQLRRART